MSWRSGGSTAEWRQVLDINLTGDFLQTKAVMTAMRELFLASDDAAFITGVALPVDGGRTIL